MACVLLHTCFKTAVYACMQHSITWDSCWGGLVLALSHLFVAAASACNSSSTFLLSFSPITSYVSSVFHLHLCKICSYIFTYLCFLYDHQEWNKNFLWTQFGWNVLDNASVLTTYKTCSTILLRIVCQCHAMGGRKQWERFFPAWRLPGSVMAAGWEFGWVGMCFHGWLVWEAWLAWAGNRRHEKERHAAFMTAATWKNPGKMLYVSKLGQASSSLFTLPSPSLSSLIFLPCLPVSDGTLPPPPYPQHHTCHCHLVISQFPAAFGLFAFPSCLPSL